MSCWKCTACGARVCDLDTCPTCHGQGLKKKVKEDKLKDALKDLGTKATFPVSHASDGDLKNFVREDI